MASLKRLDVEKLRTHRIVATASLTAIAAVFLLLMCRPAAVSVPRAAPAPSQEAAAQAPAEEIQRELAVLYLPDLAVSDAIATPATQPERAPVPQQMGPTEPDSSPTASEQRMFKSRRALETMDPREFLRHGR
jgi:hypothetical protein